MNDRSSFLTTPMAVLLSGVFISIAILVSGGVIKLGGSNTAAPAGGNPPAGQPQAEAPKTEAEIISGLKAQAKTLGLDTGKFDSCLDSGDKASLVQADLDEGVALGVNGTPAFFVNGRLLAGAVPFSQFKTIIDEELNGTAASTVERKEVKVGDVPPLGNPNAPVTIVEFSDYECPYCERHFTQTEPQIKNEYIDTGKVKFYYRDFPLSNIHPGAQKGAEAVRCAGDQGKYWEYHDLVFKNQASIF